MITKYEISYDDNEQLWIFMIVSYDVETEKKLYSTSLMWFSTLSELGQYIIKLETINAKRKELYGE